MISSQTYAGNVASKLGELARVIEDLRTLGEIYDARGGAVTFSDEALQDTGFDANGLLSIIFINNDLQSFFNNGVVPQVNRWPTVQRFRGDV
jgi:hypothetical protein